MRMNGSKDRLVYGLAYDGKMRFSCASTGSIVEEARLRHALSPMATVVLGRLLTGAVLAIPWLAEEEIITFSLETLGPLGRVVAQAKGDFTVRGYLSNPNVETKLKGERKFDVSSVVVGGTLRVIRDLRLKYPVVSQVPIQSGEIAQDIAYYYTVSEQIPTAMALGVLVGKSGTMVAGGYAIQVIDRSLEKEVITLLESRIESLNSVTSLLAEGMDPVEIVDEILKGEMVDYVEREVRFECDCNRDKAFESILVLPLEEIEEMRDEGFGEVTCKWCSARYIFSRSDLEEVIREKVRRGEGG